MKPGPVTNLDKRNKATSKKLDVDVMSENCDVIVIFRILANLEQSGCRIPNTDSAKIMFSVIVTFCFTKTENRTIKSITQLLHYCFKQRYFFGQKSLIFCKKMLISANLRGPRH